MLKAQGKHVSCNQSGLAESGAFRRAQKSQAQSKLRHVAHQPQSKGTATTTPVLFCNWHHPVLLSAQRLSYQKQGGP